MCQNPLHDLKHILHFIYRSPFILGVTVCFCCIDLSIAKISYVIEPFGRTWAYKQGALRPTSRPWAELYEHVHIPSCCRTAWSPPPRHLCSRYPWSGSDVNVPSPSPDAAWPDGGEHGHHADFQPHFDILFMCVSTAHDVVLSVPLKNCDVLLTMEEQLEKSSHLYLVVELKIKIYSNV